MVLNPLIGHNYQDVLKMEEALRTLHTCGKELLQGCWWSLGPKLLFDHMSAPVLKLLIFSNNAYYSNMVLTALCIFFIWFGYMELSYASTMIWSFSQWSYSWKLMLMTVKNYKGIGFYMV
jgi:hypothetical protein